MGKCKHVYTNEEAPTNNGSVTRPARFNMRMTCATRGRWHTALIGLREEYGDLLKGCGKSEADVVERVLLPIVEHHLRKLRIGDSATRRFFRAQAHPLPKEDHVRNLVQQMLPNFDVTVSRKAAAL